MYSDKYLEILKQEYMEQDYPKDLNDHIINCIANVSFEENSRTSIFNFKNVFFKRLAFLGLVFVVVTSLYSRKFELYDEKLNLNSRSNTLNISSYLYKNDVKETKYDIFENELMISIYPINSNYSIKDNFYNIDKELGRIVSLKEILVDDLDLITNIDHQLKESLLNEKSKFFINKNGNYIIVTYDNDNNVFLINLNHQLERIVLKDKYTFR